MDICGKISKKTGNWEEIKMVKKNWLIGFLCLVMLASGATPTEALQLAGPSTVTADDTFEVVQSKCGNNVRWEQVWDSGYVLQLTPARAERTAANLAAQVADCALTPVRRIQYKAVLPGVVRITEEVPGTREVVGRVEVSIRAKPLQAKVVDSQRVAAGGYYYPNQSYLLEVTGGHRTNHNGNISAYSVIVADDPRNVVVGFINNQQNGRSAFYGVKPMRAGDYKLTISDGLSSIIFPLTVRKMTLQWDKQEVYVNETTFLQVNYTSFSEISARTYTPLDGQRINPAIRIDPLPTNRFRVTPLAPGTHNLEVSGVDGQKIQTSLFVKAEPLKITVSPDVNSIKTGGTTVTLRVSGGVLRPGSNYILSSANPLVLRFTPSEKGVFVGTTSDAFGSTKVTVTDDFRGVATLDIPVRKRVAELPTKPRPAK